jgi:hypothetical protein
LAAVTVTTIYSVVGDGRIISEHTTTYLTARSGASLIVSTAELRVGQLGGGGGVFDCDEAFTAFDTSVIPAGDVVLSAILSLYGTSDNSSQDFTANARLRSWLPTLAAADYVAGASLSALTLLAHWASTGFVLSAYNDFTNDALIANLNLSGNTEMVIDSDREESGISPSVNEFVIFAPQAATGTTTDPKLVVTSQTPVAPTVTTSAATDVHQADATGNGNVTNDGASAITERGIVWSTSANPTTADSKVIVAGTTGAFSGAITGLAANKTYHDRAYAINAIGTSYGADDSFTTPATATQTPRINAKYTHFWGGR